MKKIVGNRIKEVRENRHMIQEIVADEIGVTQQMLSKYERDINCIKVDVLIKIAEYFNVTTDYLLGRTEIKRDMKNQVQIEKTMEEFIELIEVLRTLEPCDQELIWIVLRHLKKSSIKHKDH